VLLIATLAVNLVSAYIRLSEAGTGCSPWPECFARVGHLIQTDMPSTMEAITPVEAVKRAHRSLATGLVVLVVVLIALARRGSAGNTSPALPYAIAAVVLLLAVVGPASYLKTLPAIATANLLGGMTLLALAWVLFLQAAVRPLSDARNLRVPAMAALVVMTGQLALGAWVSANFAAAACTGLFNCAIDGAGPESFWYLRELPLDASGRIVQDGSQALIQIAHHVWASVTAAVLSWLGWRALRLGGAARFWGVLLLALLLSQVLLGWSGVAGSTPLWAVLTHNLLASLLLLVVLRLLSFAPPAPARRPVS
jgi:cytochrome c oxidase assembly protein subunit 15